jgi:hypothetical protein
VVRLEDGPHLLGIHPLGLGREAHEVGKDDAHDLAFFALGAG